MQNLLHTDVLPNSRTYVHPIDFYLHMLQFIEHASTYSLLNTPLIWELFLLRTKVDCQTKIFLFFT